MPLAGLYCVTVCGKRRCLWIPLVLNGEIPWVLGENIRYLKAAMWSLCSQTFGPSNVFNSACFRLPKCVLPVHEPFSTWKFTTFTTQFVDKEGEMDGIACNMNYATQEQKLQWMWHAREAILWWWPCMQGNIRLASLRKFACFWSRYCAFYVQYKTVELHAAN